MEPIKDSTLLETSELAKVLTFIRAQKGIDLTHYRLSFVARRMRIRMNYTKSRNHLEYIACLKSNPEEIDHFLDVLGVNVTEFFRDPDMYEAFRQKVVPELCKSKTALGQSLIRVWSAACASGEEAYSLAIVFKEELAGKSNFSIKIWGSDMDNEALEKAAKAEYKDYELKKLDNKTLEKYFIPVYNNFYRLKDEIRQMVRFQRHNLMTEPPLVNVDVIFCRNMMIYLNRQQQEVLCKKFSDALNSGGYLVTGKVENIWNKDLYSYVDARAKIYRKVR
jgi:chemotaxis methyl-accepting protein methylase